MRLVLYYGKAMTDWRRWLMNRYEMLKRFTQEQRIDVVFPGWVREASGGVVRHFSVGGEAGFVLYADIPEGEAEGVVREQIRVFRDRGQSFEWKLYDYDRPSSLRDTLEANGFRVGDREALMMLDLQAADALLSKTVPPSIRAISDADGIAELVALEDEIWGYSHAELGVRLQADLSSGKDELRMYGAYEDDVLVAAAWMYMHEGTSFISLWGGSTRAAYRRRGHYMGLLVARLRDAAARGFRLATVDASPESEPILAKNGFMRTAYTYPCEYTIEGDEEA
ncbi:GNAT family N-acetyltransferase [Paenibacillus sp. TRM 82003]|nr:GNAT family N-acetyltransferase [Paenibacillus sp. TRM 82003]